jgi:hypothetical protein
MVGWFSLIILSFISRNSFSFISFIWTQSKKLKEEVTEFLCKVYLWGTIFSIFLLDNGVDMFVLIDPDGTWIHDYGHV